MPRHSPDQSATGSGYSTLRISSSSLPCGVCNVTTSPSRALVSARATGETQLILPFSGSSSSMPTFGEWERVVLSHSYDDVDYISCHAYYEEKDGDLGSFLASAVDMDRFIESVVATADHVKAVRGSEKTINISFDEWNIWYQDRYHGVDKIEGLDNWPVAPRLLEDAYSVTDVWCSAACSSRC